MGSFARVVVCWSRAGPVLNTCDMVMFVLMDGCHGYGVGDFVIFSGAEVLKGNISVDVFEVFFAFFMYEIQF